MPFAEDAALWAGSHMRALRKQATSHCSGEKIQSFRALFVIVFHSFAHHKNTAQQQVQRKTSAFDPLLAFNLAFSRRL